MKEYELVYILHPDLEGNLEVVSGRISGFITGAGGEIISEDLWGKRKLAYPIAGLGFGVYAVVRFRVEAVQVGSLERELRLLDEVIRHLVVAYEKPRKVVSRLRKSPRKQSPKMPADEAPEEERRKKLDEKLEEIIGSEGVKG